jgi:hypothetical protein
MPATRTARILETWEQHAKVVCGDSEDQDKIVGFGTGQEFGDSISDIEDLFPIEASATEMHTNIVSGIDDDDTPDLGISNAGPSQRSIVDNNRSRDIPSPTNIEEDSFY